MVIYDRVLCDIKVDSSGSDDWIRYHFLTNADSVDCNDGETLQSKLEAYETRIAKLEAQIKELMN